MLGSHRVTRLIVGSNPIYGYSHFNQQYDLHMLEWFTDERIVKLCWTARRPASTPGRPASLEHETPIPQSSRGRMQHPIHLPGRFWHYDEKNGEGTRKTFWKGTVQCAQAAAEFKPIGIAFHGFATDALFRAGKIDLVKTFVDKVHDLGSAAGISTHNPKILDTLHEKGFANDFYMTGLHYVSRHPEDWMKEIGAHPLDEGWIDSDPPKMAEAIRKVDKPALVYKVLAAGRKCRSEEAEARSHRVGLQEHQADRRDDYRSLSAIFRSGHGNHKDGARDSGVRAPRHPPQPTRP